MGRDSGRLRPQVTTPSTSDKPPHGIVEERLREAGAVAVGVAAAGPVERSCMAGFDEWIAAGNHAGMDYMTNHRALRADPRLLLEGARSVISMAFSYRRERKRNRELPGISAYALLPDYHIWIKETIRKSGIGEILGEEGREWRICVDSAPIPERYWAVKAGIGIIGDNGALIVPGVGSDIFLAEILTVKDFKPDRPLGGDCGHCGRCRKVCPTKAIGTNGQIDCNRCLSYLTIEHRGEWIDERHRAAMATEAGRNTLFGCDRCLSVCPHNGSGRVISTQPDVIESLLEMEAVSDVTLPKLSCLRRAGRKGMNRNAINCRKS